MYKEYTYCSYILFSYPRKCYQRKYHWREFVKESFYPDYIIGRKTISFHSNYAFSNFAACQGSSVAQNVFNAGGEICTGNIVGGIQKC